MAVGDVINDVGPSPATAYFFQPSVGTEIMVFAVIGGSGTGSASINYGIGTTGAFSSNEGNNGLVVKIGITNSTYLFLYSGLVLPAWSGIQIK